MAALTPTPLTPRLVFVDREDPTFCAIASWPFGDTFVGRLLRDDIPQRVAFNSCRMWQYRDSSGSLVGFGTLDLCEDYSDYTNGQWHPYIPLLAVNPTIKSLGYGTSILLHLIGEAALLVNTPRRCISEFLFLDVYASSVKAIELYERHAFARLTSEPRLDPDDEDKPYWVMAKRVSLVTS